MTRFRRLALATATTTLGLVGLGALVRATGSGLGCLDEWPRCVGGWVAPLEYHAVIEYAHRAVAGVVVLLILALVWGAHRWTGARRGFVVAAYAALVTVIAQALLGRVVVTSELHAAYVSAHFVLALALVGLTVSIHAAARTSGRPRAAGEHRRLAGMVSGAIAGTFVLLVVGALVREKGAGLVFPDWPLMGGSILPGVASEPAALHVLHRLLALAVFGHVTALALRARRDPRPDVRSLAAGVWVAFTAQILVGAANIWTVLAPAAVIAHVTLSAVIWGLLWALVVSARAAPAPTGAAGPAPRGGEAFTDRVRAYVRLTKPRIVVLLLVTTVPAMMLAAGGFPSLGLVAATLAGGMMTAGSANAINQFLERDIDEKMNRTRARPLPAHRIEPTHALLFGVALGLAGFGLLAVVVNLLAALLALSAILFYVLVYTVWLKRTTPQNIVIGGAAGAVPVLVGWAAVTGTLALEAWILFAIIFFWTPPHFWALAMKYRDDYAAAGVPMLPVVRPVGHTTGQILAYTLVLLPVTFSLLPVAPMGLVYAAAAVGLGAGFVILALRLRLNPTAQSAMGLFRYSLSYLALLFAAIAADSMLS